MVQRLLCSECLESYCDYCGDRQTVSWKLGKGVAILNFVLNHSLCFIPFPLFLEPRDASDPELSVSVCQSGGGVSEL